MTPNFHVPNTVTKQLAMNIVGDRKKVRVSSNFLPLMGFEPGKRLITVPSLDGGFTVRTSDQGDLQVYSRRYNTRARANNPMEAIVEFASQSLLSKTFPPGTERFHVRMKQGDLKITPVPNRVFNIQKRYQGHDPLRAMVALTGGVDIRCMADVGIHTDVVLEYRPDEARDVAAGRSLNEVHALNTLRNGGPRLLLNEDIYTVDPARLRKLIDEGDPVTTYHISLQCDDASSAKSASAKAKSIDNLTTTLDQIYPMLRQVEALECPLVIVENVRQFKNSHAGIIMRSMLRRWGYHVSDMTLNARDFGGVQNRTRYYMVASIFPGFEAPQPQDRSGDSIWPLVEKHLHECRDVTDSYAVKSRGTSNRCSTYITRESTYCPAVMKSQARILKDGLAIQDAGRVYTPSEGLIKSLMSIPQDFDTSWMAAEQSIETLGQSIDYKLHHRLMESVKQHLLDNMGQRTILRARAGGRNGELFN
jgi:DNA (cytosine-5)-methyltransferase 1